MSRYRHAGLSADPLQRPRSVAIAKSEWSISSDAMLNGLWSVAPRLGLVLLIAGTLQMVLRMTGH
ncbi:hypothetical protein BJ928_11546 [Rhizobium sp. WW_1]|jgi:hypothetical protein|nr:hypothetical protein BJ928_11546 [Rhizobium sp. WW_1]